MRGFLMPSGCCANSVKGPRHTAPPCTQVFGLRWLDQKREPDARRAETKRLLKGYASRIQGVVLVGVAAVKVREEIIRILHSRPQLPPGATEWPDIACIVKMAGKIRGVGQACITGLRL